MTPEDFAKVAARAGYQATVTNSGDTRLVALTRGRRKFLAVMDWRVAKQNLYTLVALQADLTLTQRVSDEAISQVNSRSKFVKVWRTDARTVRLHMPLVLDGGVTSGVARAVAASLDEQLARMRATAPACRRAGEASPDITAGRAHSLTERWQRRSTLKKFCYRRADAHGL